MVCLSFLVFFSCPNQCILSGVLEEAKFFGLSKAIEPLEALVQTEELAINGRFTRKEFLRMLSVTSSSSSLRCQVRTRSVCQSSGTALPMRP